MNLFSKYLAVFTLLLSVPLVWAQPASPQASAPKAAFSEPQLKQFADAYRSIVMLSREYAPKLKAAADIKEAEIINKEAQGKMIAAIQKAGLSKSKYQEIANSIKSNPALLEKVNKILQQTHTPQ
ncbi:DUF4168 domain-containing protein [Microbulbifer sp. OS29]|uniref:DUF4168 domain-containing protein n=1 Tax=Microbulbifer okhotskensis TaxID=2926617 RepID=A0A9X2EPW0_9GAMM|nr:DUF4168 domain-containing protein [Microbulbifer okhotskensis]MCO1333411.1 DUF4168 domain-containing protein [Microbulbifer okhotskensis]